MAFDKMNRNPLDEANNASQADIRKAPLYQIRIRGKLDASWSDWFSGLSIDRESSGHTPELTVLTGRVTDQSVLRGILNSIWDLNLGLVSVNRLDSEDDERGW